jgi:hypothetical protein
MNQAFPDKGVEIRKPYKEDSDREEDITETTLPF